MAAIGNDPVGDTTGQMMNDRSDPPSEISHQEPTVSWQSTRVFLVVGVIVVVVLGGGIGAVARMAMNQWGSGSSSQEQSSPTPTTIAAPPTLPEKPVATPAPPLAAVDFPEKSGSYPSDWPEELRYPNQFA